MNIWFTCFWTILVVSWFSSFLHITMTSCGYTVLLCNMQILCGEAEHLAPRNALKTIIYNLCLVWPPELKISPQKNANDPTSGSKTHFGSVLPVLFSDAEKQLFDFNTIPPPNISTQHLFVSP